MRIRGHQPLLWIMIMLICAVPLGAHADAESVQQKAVQAASPVAVEKNALMLSIVIDTIYNHHFRVDLPISLNQPFKVVTSNGGVTNTVLGTVSSPVDGKYALPLSVSEWVSKSNNFSDTEELSLELDKPVSGGFDSSVVFMRTVTLTKLAY
jgi:hypothetical protein